MVSDVFLTDVSNKIEELGKRWNESIEKLNSLNSLIVNKNEFNMEEFKKALWNCHDILEKSNKLSKLLVENL